METQQKSRFVSLVQWFIPDSLRTQDLQIQKKFRVTVIIALITVFAAVPYSGFFF
jgi:hypothetical protein